MICVKGEVQEWIARVIMWSLLGTSVPMIIYGGMDIVKPEMIENGRAFGKAFMIAGVTLLMLTSMSLLVCFRSCCRTAECPANNATLLEGEASLSASPSADYQQVPIYNQHATFQLLTYPLDHVEGTPDEAPPTYHEAVSLWGKTDPVKSDINNQ